MLQFKVSLWIFNLNLELILLQIKPGTTLAKAGADILANTYCFIHLFQNNLLGTWEVLIPTSVPPAWVEDNSMLDCQTPLPALTHSLVVLEVARAQTTSALMSLPSSQCDSACGTPYPVTTEVRLAARDFSCCSKPHWGGLKMGPQITSGAHEKKPVRLSARTWYSLKAQGGKPKWKLKLAKPGNALPALQATGRMRYYIFSYTASVITKPGRWEQPPMAVLRGKKIQTRPILSSLFTNEINIRLWKWKPTTTTKSKVLLKGFCDGRTCRGPNREMFRGDFPCRVLGGDLTAPCYLIQVVSQGSQFNKLKI